MATTITGLGTPSGAKLFQETALGGSAIVLQASSISITSIQIDNTANGGQDVYFKGWNTNGAVVVGTTVPDDVILVKAGAKITPVIPETMVRNNGYQVACVTTGGTGGTTAPGSSVVA